MNYFTVIDLTLFGIFVIFISIFLYRKRINSPCIWNNVVLKSSHEFGILKEIQDSS